jgi:hypothetical protein
MTNLSQFLSELLTARWTGFAHLLGLLCCVCAFEMGRYAGRLLPKVLFCLLGIALVLHTLLFVSDGDIFWGCLQTVVTGMVSFFFYRRGRRAPGT